MRGGRVTVAQQQRGFGLRDLRRRRKEATDELISALTKLKLKSDQQSRICDISLLTVLPYVGYEAAHEDLVELKTRSSSHPFPLTEEDVYAQAVFSATPTTIAAIHDRGTFLMEEIYKLDDMEESEQVTEVKNGVRKVGDLLKKLVETLKDEPNGARYCLICKEPKDRVLALRRGGRGAGSLVNRI